MKLFHKLIKKLRRLMPKETELHEETYQDGTGSSASNESNSNVKIDNRPTAIAFVDFENWFYGYKNFYHIKPDIISWSNELEQEYNLKDILVFADFSHAEISEELSDIRCVTKSIIETRIERYNSLKDMTDFIILDYIYQYAYKYPEIDTFILFTGDSHFLYAAKFLLQVCGKKVIIYGVKDAFSHKLKNIATKAIELPASEEMMKNVYTLVVSDMEYVSKHPKIVPSFTATVRKIATKNNLPEELVRAVLDEMIRKELLLKKIQRMDDNSFITVLAPNWKKLEQEGLWSFE